MCSWLLYDNPVKSEEDRLHTCRHTQLITVLPRWYVAAYGAPRKHIGEGDKSLFWGYSSTANGIWGLAQIIGGQCPPPAAPIASPYVAGGKAASQTWNSLRISDEKRSSRVVVRFEHNLDVLLDNTTVEPLERLQAAVRRHVRTRYVADIARLKARSQPPVSVPVVTARLLK